MMLGRTGTPAGRGRAAELRPLILSQGRARGSREGAPGHSGVQGAPRSDGRRMAE
jgi:hypothetical protein